MADFDEDEYETFALDSDADEGAEEGSDDTSDAGDTEDLDDDLDDDVDEPEADEDDADEDEDEDELEDDELEDAAPDEIDFVVAAYREDGVPLVQALATDLANDLDALIRQLRRLPGDAGAIGFVSLVEEVFVIVRVRGQHIQVLLNDGAAAADWPIARDVADLLDEEIPDEEEADPMGDLGLLTDLGLSEFEMEAIVDDLDLGSDQALIQIAEKIKLGRDFRRVVEAALRA